jgi:hypothetical protein
MAKNSHSAKRTTVDVFPRSEDFSESEDQKATLYLILRLDKNVYAVRGRCPGRTCVPYNLLDREKIYISSSAPLRCLL